MSFSKKSIATRAGAGALIDVTGQTVFDDRPLRFRSLSLDSADLSAALDSPGIDGAFKIRLARHEGSRRNARDLVTHRYLGRGYSSPARQARSSLTTFIACDDGELVGTVSVGIDSAQGLSADELYREEIDPLRVRGHRVCEFTRLAVKAKVASQPVLAGLFQTAYLYAAVIHGYSHAVIEVNPRHADFYARALRFERIGAERMNRRVNAPAVLLCVSFSSIARDLSRLAGRSPSPGSKRTLFHYGFSPEEQAGVLRRLRDQLVPPSTQVRSAA